MAANDQVSTVSMIMIGLLAVNTLLLIYCAYKGSSEEFRAKGAPKKVSEEFAARKVGTPKIVRSE